MLSHEGKVPCICNKGYYQVTESTQVMSEEMLNYKDILLQSPIEKERRKNLKKKSILHLQLQQLLHGGLYSSSVICNLRLPVFVGK